MTIALLPLLLLLAAGQAAPHPPPPANPAPPPAEDNPMIMVTGAHLKSVCSNWDDRASRLVCLSWLNGASQANGWFTARDPLSVPQYCPPSPEFDLATHRELILAWLDANPDEFQTPAIIVHHRALAAAYPCKKR